MLIVAGRNRIYAVTRKDRIITSCFGVIAVSQFILGLYTIIYAALQGGECMTRCRGPQFLTTSIFQWRRSRRSHFGFMGSVFSCNTGTWKLDLPPYLSYSVRNLPCSSSGREYLQLSPRRLSSLLARRLSRAAFKRIPVPDSQSA